MNKAELINAIAETSGMTKVASKKALDATIKCITKALANGEKVGLVGFGSFTVADRAARTGINPSTKKAIKIPAKKVAKFKAGADLADAVK